MVVLRFCHKKVPIRLCVACSFKFVVVLIVEKFPNFLVLLILASGKMSIIFNAIVIQCFSFH